MQSTRKRLTVAAAVLGVAAVPVGVATAQSGGGSGTNGQPLAEQAFFTAAAASNQFEISSGQRAAQRAQQSCVRRFARDLVRDHTRQQAELRTVAAARGVTLPATPTLNATQTRDLRLIGQASSRGFDSRFLRIQVAAHVTAIRLFQSAATGQPAFTPEMSSDGSNGSGNGGNGGGSGGSAQATTPAAGSLPVVQLAVRSLPVLGRHFGEADTLRRYGCGDDRSSSSSRGNRSGDDNGGNRSGGSDDSRSGDR
jgi:predicted outer membrane protein